MAIVTADVALLLGEDPVAFNALLSSFLSTSNEERGKAEVLYKECKKYPKQLVFKFLQTLHHATQDEIRDISAILLRSLVAGSWQDLGPELFATLKTQLLEILHKESSIPVSKKLCHAISMVATVDQGKWPELLQIMFHCVSSTDVRLVEGAMIVFAEIVPEYSDAISGALDPLIAILQRHMTASANFSLSNAALNVAGCLVKSLSVEQGKDKIEPLVPAMLQVCTNSLNASDEASAQEALGTLIDIAQEEPRFFRRQIQLVLTTILQVAEAKDMEDDTRCLAVQFVVELIDARSKAPGMIKKYPEVVSRLFAVLLDMMLSIEDSPEWYQADDEVEDSELYETGQVNMDYISLALMGNVIVPIASQQLPSFLSDPDWKKRNAAITTIGMIAEGCAKVMLTMLGSVVGMVIAACNDPHARVRWAAINTIGQLCNDLSPDLQDQHHQTLVPALVQCMDESNHPRVQAHACTALLNFVDGCSEGVMTPYMDAIVAKLLHLLERGKRLTQEAAITSLAAVADHSEVQFMKYYDVVMPYLKGVLFNFQEKEHRLLRSKAIETISLVGLSVGIEKFRPDAQQLIEVLVQLQGSSMDDDDPTGSYLMQAWARLCKCMGKEFLPLMGVVMPPLLAAAQLKPEVDSFSRKDGDDEEDEDDDDDDGIEFYDVGKDAPIAIRTSIVEEKALACNMLCCYVEELKELFYPWLDQVAKLVVPFLSYYYSDIRKAAAQSLPLILESGKLAVEKGVVVREPSYLKELFDFMFNKLISMITVEADKEVLIEMLESLNDLVKSADRQLLSEAQISVLLEQLKIMVQAGQADRKARAKRQDSEDFDEEERAILEEENEIDDSLFEQAGDIIGSLIKSFQAQFIPFFDQLVPFLLPLLSNQVSSGERRVAICIFDDAFEILQGNAVKYFDTILPLFLECATDASAEVRQASVYGIGVCAQYGGDAFKPFLSESLNRLTAVVSQPDSRSSDNEYASDNAVSAIGKICEFQSEGIDVSAIITSWLNYLPMKGDLAEAKVVHQHLCQFLARGDVRLYGHNYQNLPKILSVFADVLNGGSTFATEETVAQMKSLLNSFQQNIGQDVLGAAWNTLQHQQQVCLQTNLSA